MQPVEETSRDTIKPSDETSALDLCNEDSVRSDKHLKRDKEQDSCTKFEVPDVKYLLYEDEWDFKVRFMRKF